MIRPVLLDLSQLHKRAGKKRGLNAPGVWLRCDVAKQAVHSAQSRERQARSWVVMLRLLPSRAVSFTSTYDGIRWVCWGVKSYIGK